MGVKVPDRSFVPRFPNAVASSDALAENGGTGREVGIMKYLWNSVQ